MMSPLVPPQELGPTVPARCLNCDAPLDGRFCAACGQEARDPKPTTQELLHAAAGEFFNWDGKLFGTLRTLVSKPGLLTAELLAGRRARYLPPLRLYLICSVAFFALSAMLPSKRPLKVRYAAPAPGDSIRARQQAGMTREERSKADIAEACRKAAADSASGSVAIRLSARAACRANEGTDAYMGEVGSYYPKVAFLLLPIYALILSLVYRNRRYPEHLYFALHGHAFAFLMLIAARLVAAGPVRPVARWSTMAAILVVLAYSWLAQRRVYGDTVLMTTGKTVIVTLVYAFAFLMAVTAAALIALLN